MPRAVCSRDSGSSDRSWLSFCRKRRRHASTFSLLQTLHLTANLRSSSTDSPVDEAGDTSSACSTFDSDKGSTRVEHGICEICGRLVTSVDHRLKTGSGRRLSPCAGRRIPKMWRGRTSWNIYETADHGPPPDVRGESSGISGFRPGCKSISECTATATSDAKP